MKCEIKSWFDGSIKFSGEFGSMKLCVEAAVKAGADLTRADLTGADLTGADLKPMGFWYGVDGDWERWCRAESWGLGPEQFEHEVMLGDEKLLMIATVEEIDSFHKKYHARPGRSYSLEYIDWRAVALDFDGIEIAPYQFERRLGRNSHHWYYPWDCASGCIWRPRGIKTRLLRTVHA